MATHRRGGRSLYERRGERLLRRPAFLRRLARHGGLALLLGGMGPVGDMGPASGKIFASIYALYSGLVFLIVAGLLFAPVFHRILHRFHVDEEP